MNRLGAVVVFGLALITASLSCTMPSVESTGACCQGDGTCEDTTAANCTSNGVFNEGESCDAFQCSSSDSACCLEDGSCLDVTSAECDTANGTFNDSSSCDDVQCPKSGACCLIDGTCEDSNSDDCEAKSGTFQEGEVCEDVDCPQPGPQVGACCLDDGSCLNADSNGCATVSGAFDGGGTCDDVDCPEPGPANGSCCLDNGLCVDDSNSEVCGSVDGTFNEMQLCLEVDCEQPIGACCLLDGSCIVVEAADCFAMDATFNQGETCAEVQCDGPSLQEVEDMAEELESIVRDDLEYYIQTVSIVGREYWNLNGDDSEYTEELMGKIGQMLDEDSDLVTRSFIARYKAVRHCQSLITATMNADAGLTTEQENGLYGYAKTWQAYSLLLTANQQFATGVLPPSELDAQNKSAEFLSYSDSLQLIADLLDEAASNLTNGGASFIFNLDSGFSGFSTPATFRQFNRALSARVRIYQGDKSGSISGIAGAFFNINGSMATGPGFGFGSNPMYYEPDVDLFTVHPDWISDLDAGDLRFNPKTRNYVASVDLAVPVVHDGLSGSRQVQTIATQSDPFPIIRNEELILIYAEAQIGSDVNESLAAINRVRNASGLGNYLGATDDASMLNEVIKQRRFSLFGEGHRWIDLRRTGKIGQVNVDRPGDVVHNQFPRPGTEVVNGL